MEAPKDKVSIESVKISSGNVLRTLNESKVRRICGEVIYRAGLQDYTLGRVSEEKFADNTLLGKVHTKGNKSRGLNESQYFQPSITLEKNTKAIRIFGECECTLAREGTLCPHMAALLITWAREPRKFKEDVEYLRSRLEKARQGAVSSLEELLSFVENSSTSKAEVFSLLQETYSKIRSWREGVKEVNRDRGAHFDPLREFSCTINYASLAIMSALERKYSLRTLDIYNSATLATFGRVLALFAESTGDRDKSPAAPTSCAKKLGKKSDNGVSSSSQKTTRSWDILIENFARE